MTIYVWEDLQNPNCHHNNLGLEITPLTFLLSLDRALFTFLHLFSLMVPGSETLESTLSCEKVMHGSLCFNVLSIKCLSQDLNLISSRSAWVLMSEPIIFRVRFGKRSLMLRCGANAAGVLSQIPIRRLCHTGSTGYLVGRLPALCLLPSGRPEHSTQSSYIL